MSRWLQNVNNFLDNLDGTIGEVIEDREVLRDDGPTTSSVHDILSKRGIQQFDDEDEEEEEEEEEVEYYEDDVEEEQEVEESLTEDADGSQVHNEDETDCDENEEDEKSGDQAQEEGVGRENEEPPEGISTTKNSIEEDDESGQDLQKDTDQDTPDENDHTEPNDSNDNTDDSVVTSISNKPSENKTSNNPPAETNTESTKKMNNATVEKSSSAEDRENRIKLKASEREARKLRHNVVQLNSQLESLEHEMSAQANELQRAAERMERDRTRHKEEIANVNELHNENIERMTSQHADEIERLQKSYSEKIQDLQQQLQNAEQTRIKEGGDYQGELKETIQREQQLIEKLMIVEDKNTTCESQINMLQTQMSSLESSLRNARQTAETCSERERDAEDRLDAASSLHARQLSQRQAREYELERKIGDLTAALVVSKQKQTMSSVKNVEPNEKKTESENQSSILELQDQLDSTKTQLDIERLQIKTLHTELEEIAKERTQEEATNLARQRQYERKVSDLSNTVTKLQSQISLMTDKVTTQTSGDDTSGRGAKEENKQLKSQIAYLSEQILKHQTKQELDSTEISTLKSRLRQAVSRAEEAEDIANTANAHLSTLTNNSDIGRYNHNAYDLEAETGLGRLNNNTMRSRHNRKGRTKALSIRSALNLNTTASQFDSSTGENFKEQLGKTIDALDKFTIETGSILKYNPIPRALFLLYFMILHVWTFILISYHAQHFEKVHGDFGGFGSNLLDENDNLHHAGPIPNHYQP